MFITFQLKTLEKPNTVPGSVHHKLASQIKKQTRNILHFRQKRLSRGLLSLLIYNTKSKSKVNDQLFSVYPFTSKFGYGKNNK